MGNISDNNKEKVYNSHIHHSPQKKAKMNEENVSKDNWLLVINTFLWSYVQIFAYEENKQQKLKHKLEDSCKFSVVTLRTL